MTPELVIFDCDGVLVDSEGPSNEVTVQNLARYGLNLTTAQGMELFMGLSMSHMRQKIIDMGADLPHDWIDEIYRETYTRLRLGVDPIPSVIDILDQLDAVKIPYCVVSNGSEEKMGITLGQNKLLERFEGNLFSAHNLGVAKPDPALFLTALERFNIAPDRAVVIEDSPSGAEGARRAGIPCYGFAPHDDGRSLTTKGAIVFHAIPELESLLNLKPKA